MTDHLGASNWLANCIHLYPLKMDVTWRFATWRSCGSNSYTAIFIYRQSWFRSNPNPKYPFLIQGLDFVGNISQQDLGLIHYKEPPPRCFWSRYKYNDGGTPGRPAFRSGLFSLLLNMSHGLPLDLSQVVSERNTCLLRQVKHYQNCWIWHPLCCDLRVVGFPGVKWSDRWKLCLTQMDTRAERNWT